MITKEEYAQLSLYVHTVNHFKKSLRILLLMIAALQVTACSKTVQWEEEVPLNTGETIWVKRSIVYSRQGGAGNPFDIAYRPESDQSITFTWNGKKYHYEGDARIMVLAISPNGTPVLLANAEDNAWEARHHYACTIPFYVQLTPDAAGRAWTWPQKVETWTYNQPANLLLQRHAPEQMKKRYTAIDRQTEDATGALQAPWQQRIDPTNAGDLCKHLGSKK